MYYHIRKFYNAECFTISLYGKTFCILQNFMVLPLIGTLQNSCLPAVVVTIRGPASSCCISIWQVPTKLGLKIDEDG